MDTCGTQRDPHEVELESSHMIGLLHPFREGAGPECTAEEEKHSHTKQHRPKRTEQHR